MSRITRACLLLSLMLMGVAPTAQALCTQQQQSWYPYTWINLLYEENFDETCPTGGWVGEDRATTWECSMPLSPRQDSIAVLDAVGGYYGGDGFYQDFSVPTTGGNPVDIELTAHVTVTGTPSSWDVLKFNLVDLSTGSTVWHGDVRTHLSTLTCTRKSFQIGGNLSGKNLRLEVYGQIVSEGVEMHVVALRMSLYL